MVYVQPSSSLRKGHGPSFCKSVGRGRHEVSLEVGAGQCGWKREGQKVRLDLYVQYDAHVQQAIDEQMTVECDMAMREGQIVTVPYRGEGMSVSVQSMVQSYGVGHSWVSEEEEELLEEMENEIETDLTKRGRMDEDHVRVMGWLDITEGSKAGGKSISKPLEEGQYVMISAKVKQVEGMDTMMTRCVMEDGQGEVKVLTDERGCSLDKEIVGNVERKHNEATKVMEMFANFQVPKFGVLTLHSLMLTCSVVVCGGNCPVSPCEDMEQPIRVREMIVLETEAVVERVEKVEAVTTDVAPSVKMSSYNRSIDQDRAESQLCLSPARIFLAFGVLLSIIVLALLFSCVLWMKARRRIMPRPPLHPRQRGAYIMPSRARPYIRVLT